MAVGRLERELDEIAIASRHQLIERWRRLMKREPPRYASVEFLRFVAAYAVQERALGGLSPQPVTLRGCVHERPVRILQADAANSSASTAW